MKKVESLGRHLLVEYYGCDNSVLNDIDKIKKYMCEAAEKSGATIVEKVFHLFNPYGVSGVVVIAESHLAIHTWPEYGFAAVDLFTCGTDVEPWIAFDYLKKKLKAEYNMVMEMKRGLLDVGKNELLFKPNANQNFEQEKNQVRLKAV